MAVQVGRKGVIDACFPCYKINPDLRMVEPAPLSTPVLETITGYWVEQNNQ